MEYHVAVNIDALDWQSSAMKMSASWFLNVFGLIVSTVAAAIMFYYPPRGRAFTEEGAEIGSLVNNPKPEYAALG